jgi:hypothetical protein
MDGWAARYRNSAVVPDRGAPIITKFGNLLMSLCMAAATWRLLGLFDDCLPANPERRWRRSLRELPKACVSSDELVESSDVDDGAVGKEDDAVRPPDGGETVSDEDHRPVLRCLV